MHLLFLYLTMVDVLLSLPAVACSLEFDDFDFADEASALSVLFMTLSSHSSPSSSLLSSQKREKRVALFSKKKIARKDISIL